MAVYLMTGKPEQLLNSFKQKIDAGEVDTWSYDADGDFTHTPSQWERRAWLRPLLQDDRLQLKIINSRKYDLTWAIYGVYHGRFIESMLTHCCDLFTSARATKPTGGDSKPVD